MVLCVVSGSKIFVNDKITGRSISEQPKIKVEGLEESMANVGVDDVGILEMELLDVVKKNTPGTNVDIDQAVLRDGSVSTHYFEDINMNYYSSIVDLPDLEQSYWIFHEYSEDKDNVYWSTDMRYAVLCLADSDRIIYPEFDCKSDYGQLTYIIIAKKYIGQYRFKEFMVRDDLGEDEYSKIGLIALKGDAAQNGEKYIEDVKDTIASLGISPDLFEYEVVNPIDVPSFQYVDRDDL